MLNTSSMYRLSMAPSGAPPICCSIKSSLICRTWSIALSPHLFYVVAGTLSSQNREVNTARNQVASSILCKFLEGFSLPGAETPQGIYTKYLTLQDRKSTRLNSSHLVISYAVFCLKKKNK